MTRIHTVEIYFYELVFLLLLLLRTFSSCVCFALSFIVAQCREKEREGQRILSIRNSRLLSRYIRFVLGWFVFFGFLEFLYYAVLDYSRTNETRRVSIFCQVGNKIRIFSSWTIV